MVSIHAAGHCFGGSASRKGSRNPKLCKQKLAERLKLWFIQMRISVNTGGGQGLPEASPIPLVHIEDTVGTLEFTQVTEHKENRKMCETL